MFASNGVSSLESTHRHTQPHTWKVWAFVTIRARKRDGGFLATKIYACYIILGSITFRLGSGERKKKTTVLEPNSNAIQFDVSVKKRWGKQIT